jgi:hypothetical protein
MIILDSSIFKKQTRIASSQKKNQYSLTKVTQASG